MRGNDEKIIFRFHFGLFCTNFMGATSIFPSPKHCVKFEKIVEESKAVMQTQRCNQKPVKRLRWK